MVEYVLLQKFALAFLLAALIGLEREYARYRKKGHDYAGIRTFPLIGLFGALSAYLGELYSIWILVFSVVLIGVLIIAAYVAITRKTKVHFGATSEIAGFLTFFIGVLCYDGEFALATLLAVSITLVLYARTMLHHFAEHIKQIELIDTIKFAIIAFVILPFLPNQNYGPLGIFNPYLFWLMVVLVCGVSFAGYILMKWIGHKGIVLTGILGGLASSTAATVDFSHHSRHARANHFSLALATNLANGMMYVHFLILAFLLSPALFYKILLPFLSLLLLSFILALFCWRKSRQGKKSMLHLQSPFTLAPALKFAFFFAVVLALVRVGNYYLSNQGVYIISFLSGFVSVNALLLSLTELIKTDFSLRIAAKCLMMATLTNMLTKSAIVYWTGSDKYKRIVITSLSLMIIWGVVLFFWI